MASASTPSANEQTKDLILFHTVQLNPMIKAQISGKMISSDISDVAITSVHSKQTHLKTCMIIMIVIIITEKHLLVNEKGNVGMAKCFSKKYGNKTTKSYVKMPVSA